MAALLLVALAVPDAFEDHGLEFALAYTAVRAAHIALFLLASRDDPGLRRSVLGITVGTALACALLIGGALLDTGPQVALWTLALAVDMGEPYFASAEHWRLAPEHFAERHGLIVIVALGETIVALGVGADVGLTVGVATAAVLGMVLVAELWWVYFDVVAIVERAPARERATRAGAERHGARRVLVPPLPPGRRDRDRGVRAARDARARERSRSTTWPRSRSSAASAIYLLGHVAVRLRGAAHLELAAAGAGGRAAGAGAACRRARLVGRTSRWSRRCWWA